LRSARITSEVASNPRRTLLGCHVRSPPRWARHRVVRRRSQDLRPVPSGRRASGGGVGPLQGQRCSSAARFRNDFGRSLRHRPGYCDVAGALAFVTPRMGHWPCRMTRWLPRLRAGAGLLGDRVNGFHRQLRATVDNEVRNPSIRSRLTGVRQHQVVLIYLPSTPASDRSVRWTCPVRGASVFLRSLRKSMSEACVGALCSDCGGSTGSAIRRGRGPFS
jgi:hypothetical protein